MLLLNELLTEAPDTTPVDTKPRPQNLYQQQQERPRKLHSTQIPSATTAVTARLYYTRPAYLD